MLTTLRSVLQTWRAVFIDESRTSQQVAAAVAMFDPNTPDGEALAALRAALVPIAAERGIIDSGKLGYWLRKSNGRPVDGWKFDILGTPKGCSAWADVPA